VPQAFLNNLGGQAIALLAGKGGSKRVKKPTSRDKRR